MAAKKSKKKPAKPMEWTENVSNSDISPTLTAALDQVVECYFTLAWSPPNNSPIHVFNVKVNGLDLLPSTGVFDGQSPLAPVFVGRFPVGTTIALEWGLSSLNDLNGIGAYAGVRGGSEWTLLDKKLGVGAKSLWTAKATYKVSL
jgi:hypothetical protein